MVMRLSKVKYDFKRILKKYKVFPLIDPQVKHSYGKLRSLGLLVHLFSTKNMGCMRPRFVYATFPYVKIYTPRSFKNGSPPHFEYHCTVMSQKEEEHHGLIARSFLHLPFIAVVESHDFVPQGFDRKLIPYVGISIYYPQIYREYVKDLKKPVLKNCCNLFLQIYYNRYLELSGKNEAELSDLFDFDDPFTLSFPWWKWLARWANLMKKYPWFRRNYQQHIRRSLRLWIEDKKQMEKIEAKLFFLIEGRFKEDPDKIIRGVRERVLEKRHSKLESSRR